MLAKNINYIEYKEYLKESITEIKNHTNHMNNYREHFFNEIGHDGVNNIINNTHEFIIEHKELLTELENNLDEFIDSV